MQDRYHLTRDENVFLAKKHWSESIFSGMRMENRNVTFPQTQTILNGINVAGVSLSDVQAILNMRDAWRYLLENIDLPLSIDLLCEIQARVAFREALVCGKLRTGAVGISGVRYVPPIPVCPIVEQELSELLSGETTATDKALSLFAWLARKQLFWDGNKRTAILAANKVLIEHGAGVLIVPDRHMLTFNALLAEFYESDNADALTEFLYTQAIIGIEYEATDEEPEAEPASSAEGE
ncbi:MAG: Fic family protein, partial [Coriobacteriia bacterium]|nr:Fic family protein [Coriobacteriia bacterium]